MIPKDLADLVALLGNLGQFAQGLLAVGAAFFAWRYGLIDRLREFRHTRREELRASEARALWASFLKVQGELTGLSNVEGRRTKEEILHLYADLHTACRDLVDRLGVASLYMPSEVIDAVKKYFKEVGLPAMVALEGVIAKTEEAHDGSLLAAEFKAKLDTHHDQLHRAVKHIAGFDDAPTA